MAIYIPKVQVSIDFYPEVDLWVSIVAACIYKRSLLAMSVEAGAVAPMEASGLAKKKHRKN